MRDIYISMKSFNREEVLEFGQASFIDTVVGVGATGVGIQRELLRNEADLHVIAEKVNHTTLNVVYAANVDVFHEDGSMNVEEVTQVIEEANQVHACMVKVNLGAFVDDTMNVEQLRQVLTLASDMKVVVMPNELCKEGIDTFKTFALRCEQHQLHMGIGFDCGTWCVNSEEFNYAMDQLLNHVGLIHLKRVVKEGEQYYVVPLNNAKEAKWKQVLAHNTTCPVCIDFSLHTTEEGKYYVDLIKNYVNQYVLA